ncbi:MAG: PilW family protein [Sphingobium sp.]
MTMRAFTLIEMLVYLGLFMLLMNGTIVSAYAIGESADRSRAEARLQQEGAFLLNALRWNLQGAAIVYPAEGETRDAMRLRSRSGEEVAFLLRNSDLRISDERGERPMSSYEIEEIIFSHGGERRSVPDPERIDISFTLTKAAKGRILRQEFSETLYADAP